MDDPLGEALEVCEDLATTGGPLIEAASRRQLTPRERAHLRVIVRDAERVAAWRSAYADPLVTPWERRAAAAAPVASEGEGAAPLPSPVTSHQPLATFLARLRRCFRG